MIKKILVELDKTPASDSVIKYAVELAKAHNAELTGVTLVDFKKVGNVGPILPGGIYSAIDTYEERIAKTNIAIREKTSRFIALCEAGSVAYRVEHETGDPFSIMISKARYHDLILIGLDTLFDYHVDAINESEHTLERLVREGVRPIFAIPEHYRPIKRVLIAYSGNLHSAEAMKQFLQCRLWPDVLCRVACFGKSSEKATQILQEGVSCCHAHGFLTDAMRLSGDSPDALIEHAEKWDADLIVLGTAMRNVLMKEVFGNVTRYLIEHSKKALFISR